MDGARYRALSPVGTERLSPSCLPQSSWELRALRLMASEVANALWRKGRMGQIERDDDAISVLSDMLVRCALILRKGR